MPMINPEKVIKDSFKQYQKRKPSKGRKVEDGKKKEVKKGEEQPEQDKTKRVGDEGQFEEILLRPISTKSGFLSGESGEASRGGESVSDGSVEVIEERLRSKDDRGDKLMQIQEPLSATTQANTVSIKSENTVADEEGGKAKRVLKRNNDDRRRTTWLPCTCPQYKVSNQLASKKDIQGLFFAKVMTIKVIQLLLINVVIFATGLDRKKTYDFLSASHDWAFLAFGIFVAILIVLRVGLSYRSRWPKPLALILIIPLTLIIAFVCCCITVVYNSVLVPLITCTIFLAFLMLGFTPYLLKKFVMHRTTNCAAAALTLLSSIMLIFLKEMESKEISYWDFVSHVWIPAVILSQLIVQITIFEIQRVLFGLCFNVSSNRWHIAALYV